MTRPVPCLLGLSLLLGGCARDLRTWVDRDDAPPASTVATGETLASTGTLDTGADLSVEHVVRIDATDEVEPVHYDFEREGLVASDLPWDLQIRRYVVALNGGSSGTGQGAAVALEGGCDAVVEAPAEGWVEDAQDADGDGIDELALNDWYDYDVETHVLTPRPLCWVLRSAEGDHYALEFLDYYDDAGTPAMLLLRWFAVAPPA